MNERSQRQRAAHSQLASLAPAVSRRIPRDHPLGFVLRGFVDRPGLFPAPCDWPIGRGTQYHRNTIEQAATNHDARSK
ncbi:MAG: hypothetical protein K2Y37_09885 [Pirellulales bacterium]|nr:hypothetical protein [Pirellulales bacterium]